MNEMQGLENPPPLHPFVAPLSYLLGTWRGQGEGEYPTIPSFGYGEELRFSHSGKVKRSDLDPICIPKIMIT